MRDLEDSDEETEMNLLKNSKLQQSDNLIQMDDTNNYRDIGEQESLANEN